MLKQRIRKMCKMASSAYSIAVEDTDIVVRLNCNTISQDALGDSLITWNWKQYGTKAN